LKNSASLVLAWLDGLFEHPASPTSGAILDKQTLEDKDDLTGSTSGPIGPLRFT